MHRPRPTSSRSGSPRRAPRSAIDGLVLKRDVYYTLDPSEVGLCELRRRPALGRLRGLLRPAVGPARFAALEHRRPRDYPIAPGRYLMLGDNSPWSRDGRAWGRADQIDPDRPDRGWDDSGPGELGGPRSAPDRQGVLRLLAPPQAGLAQPPVRRRHPLAGPSVHLHGCDGFANEPDVHVGRELGLAPASGPTGR